MITLLVDADVPVYQSSVVSQCAIDWGDGVSSIATDLKKATRKIQRDLDELQEKLQADHLVICLSDDEVNFRKSILPSYKSNRKDVEKPLLLKQVREYLMEHYTYYLRPTLEGDDVLGILMTNPKVIRGKKIMVSIDKDMKTVPGFLYNPMKPDLGVVEVSELDADLFHMTQALTGDAVDGYKGCPRIGPVKALGIFLDVMEEPLTGQDLRRGLWQAVVDTYATKGLTEADALVQAQVARICRTTDYDYTAKVVKPWQPPTLTEE